MSVEALLGAPRRLDVERAIGEFRSGRPCLVETGGGGAVLVAPCEGLEDRRLEALRGFSRDGAVTLAMTGRRLHWLGRMEQEPPIVAVTLAEPFDARRLLDLVIGDRARAATVGIVEMRSPECGAEAGVELARLAHLAPAAIQVALDPARAAELAPYMVSVAAAAVLAYPVEVPADLAIVSQARVPLRPDIDTRFVVFRGGASLHDQVAILIGAPDLSAPVPVRLHSACLTGDLFGSLKCDCGDQLRNTVERFHQMGGGVLLYLDQEGRGIGIANKMRAYSLQAAGFDTIDADAQLGFGDDERRYDEAARMLKLLGYTRVQLHSNNPRKGEALMHAGLEVVSREAVATPVTRENAKYLKTKARRAGHMIDADWVDEVETALVAAAVRTAAE